MSRVSDIRTTTRIIGAAIMAARTRPWGVKVAEVVDDDAVEADGLIVVGELVAVDVEVARAVELELIAAVCFTCQYRTECFLDLDVLMFLQHSVQRRRNLHHLFFAKV